jgi:hypothetical protein
MAQLLPIPTAIPEAVSTGYQRQNTNFNAVTVGHINLGLGNINNSNAPTMGEGSVVEVNGGIYRCTGTDSITDASSSDGLSPLQQDALNYIYAVPGSSTPPNLHGGIQVPSLLGMYRRAAGTPETTGRWQSCFIPADNTTGKSFWTVLTPCSR